MTTREEVEWVLYGYAIMALLAASVAIAFYAHRAGRGA